MSRFSMRALVLHAVGDLRVESVDRPEPGPGEVRVRVGFCGVCGSDVPRVFSKGTYQFPTICGHEFAGTVDAAGEKVDDLSPGDRVAVFPLLWCGRCAACEQGKYVMCEDYDYLGSRSDGGFAEYVVAPRRNLLRVPENVPIEIAAMTEPAAVALHALRRAGGVGIGETCAVFGAGPIGVMVAQWARGMGASKVLLFDVVPEKLDLVRGLGFTAVFNSRDQDPREAVESETEGRGADVCVEAAGRPETLVQAAASAGREGRVVLLGNPSADATLSTELISQIMRREISLLGTWNSEYSAAGNRDDWSDVLQAMSRGLLHLEPLITHRVALDESISALKMMRDAAGFYSKVLIAP